MRRIAAGRTHGRRFNDFDKLPRCAFVPLATVVKPKGKASISAIENGKAAARVYGDYLMTLASAPIARKRTPGGRVENRPPPRTMMPRKPPQ